MFSYMHTRHFFHEMYEAFLFVLLPLYIFFLWGAFFTKETSVKDSAAKQKDKHE